MKNEMKIECPECHFVNDFSESHRWNDGFKDDAGPTNVDCSMCGIDFWVQPVLAIKLELADDD